MTSATGFVCVPIDIALYNELVIRVGNPHNDVTGLIEHAVTTYLDRTEEDEWSEMYASWKNAQKPGRDFQKEYGDPAKGVYWTPLFLPNGTKIIMPYEGKTYEAEIRHEKIIYLDEELSSPSTLASTIANGTSRNAWRDLRIKRPTDHEFMLADELRHQKPR